MPTGGPSGAARAAQVARRGLRAPRRSARWPPRRPWPTTRPSARLYHQLLQYQNRLDSMTTGPWRASPNNPDVVQLKGWPASTTQMARGASAASSRAIEARIEALGALRRQTGASIEVLPAMAEEEMRLNRRVDALAGLGDDIRQELSAGPHGGGGRGGRHRRRRPGRPALRAAPHGVRVKLALGLMLGLAARSGAGLHARGAQHLDPPARGPRGGAARAWSRGDSPDHRRIASGRGHFRRLLGSAAASRKADVGSPMAGTPDVLDRHRGLPEPSHQPDLVGWRRGAQDPGRDQRHAGRGQDADRGQPRRHAGVRRAPGAARRLRHPPAAGPWASSAAPRARPDGDADRDRHAGRRAPPGHPGDRRSRGSRC